MSPKMLKKKLSWRPGWLVTALLLLGMVSGDQRQPRRLQQCQRPPPFMVNRVAPMALAEGHVTMVALLTSTCPFCISQAGRMQSMHERHQDDGNEVHMIIVNAGPRPSAGEPGIFEQTVNFPVYHDDDDRTIWNRVFRGSKDDIFIFNRCGQLTYRIPFPYSYLGYSYVRRALRRTATRPICRTCPPNAEDTMMGDAPVSAESGSVAGGRRSGSRRGRSRPANNRRGNWPRRSRKHRSRNRSRCSGDDELCRELRRGRRIFNRFRSQHGIGLHSNMREEEILRLFERGQRLGGSRMGPVA